MPRLTDRQQIRARLEYDRPWSVYALGDLAPGYWEQSEWYGPEDGADAVALLYRAAVPPVLMTCGDPVGLASALEELPPEPELMLSVRPEALDPIRRRWDVPTPTLMWRMLLVGEFPGVEASVPVVRLREDSLDEILELFRDGEPTGEAPDFFLPTMLQHGVYFGVREGGRLTAAAGTHLAVPSEGVATIGNVYTRRDRRGRGLGRAATASVVDELLRCGFNTIALNVRQTNAAAIAVYQPLGFRVYCPFYEGRARLRTPR
ncbi:MAG: GNAT family N-acetyltransferase [Actinomycetota bacterium]